jgi:two-component system cell cycle sensor histidine kinase/response regulator CckA
MTSNTAPVDLLQLQQELKDSQARQRALLEFSLDSIICANEQAIITDFNPAAERTFRMPRSQALGNDLVATILPTSLRDRLRGDLFTSVNGDIDVVGNRRETRCLRNDGSSFPAEITVTQVTFDKQVSYVIYVRDITARRIAEEELVRLAAIVESSHDAIFSVNMSGHITCWNKGAEVIYGYSRIEVTGRHLTILTPPEKLEESMSILRGIRVGKSVENLESVRMAKSGRRIDVSLTISPLLDVEGNIIGASSIARDITSQKRAEEELRKANETSIYASPVPIVVADNNSHVTMWNPAAEALFGWNEYEVFGKPNPIIPDEHSEETARMHSDLLNGQILTGREVLRQKRDGSKVIVNLSAAPIRDVNRKVKGIIGFLTDVTEIRRDQEILRRTEEKYRTIFENAVEGIYQSTPDGKYLSANPALVRMLGFDSEEELIKTRTDIRAQEYVNPDMRDAFLKAMNEHGFVQKFEYQVYRKDGKTIWMSENARAVLSPQGTIHHFEGTVQDITQHRELEEQLRQMQKIEAIGRLAGGVAHDFNNILMAISSYAELLNRKLTEDKLLRYSDEIVKATDRGSSLTQSLLTFSRKQVFSSKIVDMNSLIADQLKMLKRLIPENIDLKFISGDGIECVKADPSQLEQVVMNLVINARDAMPNGGRLVIETSNAQLDEVLPDSPGSTDIAASYVLLTVSDNGSGMDAETKSHIFEPFFTTKEQGKGTGLGLSTVFGIVKHSGGRIFVDSEPAVGTTFKVFFPAVEAKVQAATTEDQDVQVSGTGTILLVEDEEGVREAATEYLSANGYTVLAAKCGPEALQLAVQNDCNIDVLLTDLVMPEMSGRELAEKIEVRYPQICTVFMSGYSRNLLSNQQLSDSRHILLQKPFRLASLGRCVREALANQKAAAVAAG